MDSDLAAERQARLLAFLKMRAPDIVVADNCRLVLRSYCGNSDLRVIGWLVRELVRSMRARWTCAMRGGLHGLLLGRGFHWSYDPFGDGECLICSAEREFAAPQDQETEGGEWATRWKSR